MTEVLEGEIIDASTELEVGRLRDIAPEQQANELTTMLINAHCELIAACERHDLSAVRDIKARACTLQEIAKQLQLGTEIQLDAVAFVRRAERGLGVAIREGQARGDVETTKDARSRAAIERDIRLGRSTKTSEVFVPKMKLSDIAKPSTLNGVFSNVTGVNRPGIWAMTDGVTEEQFDQALTEARAAGKLRELSRAQIARRARAKAEARQSLDAALSESSTPEPPPPRKTKKTAAARKVMEDLTISINSLAFVLAETNPDEVDLKNHESDIEDILVGTSTIRRFVNKVKEQR